jgi:protein SCO1/2
MKIFNARSRTTLSLPVVLSLVMLSLSFMFFAPDARAQTNAGSQRTSQPKPPAPPELKTAGEADASGQATKGQAAAQKYFSDITLVNQDGEPVRFYSDLLKDKVVVINAFFATCQGSCLPMNRNLEKVQEAFRNRMGKDLLIISISVDPELDTPASLKEYAKKLNAAPGRLFITGKKENVNWALYKLGQYVEYREQHTNIFIVGNERTGLWKKVFGLAKADEIIKAVESVLNDTGKIGGVPK